jgi:hypothetical protein
MGSTCPECGSGQRSEAESEMSEAKHKTAGPIENFETGWAFIWPGKKVHQWVSFYAKEGVRFHTAKCGHLAATYDRKPALAGGSFPKCKRCELGRVKRRKRA